MKPKHTSFIHGFIGLLILISFSTNAVSQACSVCNALVDIEISPNFPGTTIIDPADQAIYKSGTITNISGASMMLKGGNFSLLNVDIPTAGEGTFDIQSGSTLSVDP